MSKIQKHQELDPELAALFSSPAGEAQKVYEPTVEPKPRSQPPAGATGDALMTLKEMAESRQANARDRKTIEPGFDTVENDLSNVLGLGWDFITRPL